MSEAGESKEGAPAPAPTAIKRNLSTRMASVFNLRDKVSATLRRRPGMKVPKIAMPNLPNFKRKKAVVDAANAAPIQGTDIQKTGLPQELKDIVASDNFVLVVSEDFVDSGFIVPDSDEDPAHQFHFSHKSSEEVLTKMLPLLSEDAVSKVTEDKEAGRFDEALKKLKDVLGKPAYIETLMSSGSFDSECKAIELPFILLKALNPNLIISFSPDNVVSQAFPEAKVLSGQDIEDKQISFSSITSQTVINVRGEAGRDKVLALDDEDLSEVLQYPSVRRFFVDGMSNTSFLFLGGRFKKGSSSPLAEMLKNILPEVSETSKVEEPAAEKVEPSVEKEAGTEKAEPVAEKKEPVAEATEASDEKAEPSAEKKEPAAENEEPAAEKKEPAAEKKEPAAEKKEPAAEKTEPTAEKKEPAAEKTEPETQATPQGPSHFGFFPTLEAGEKYEDPVDTLVNLLQYNPDLHDGDAGVAGAQWKVLALLNEEKTHESLLSKSGTRCFFKEGAGESIKFLGQKREVEAEMKGLKCLSTDVLELFATEAELEALPDEEGAIARDRVNNLSKLVSKIDVDILICKEQIEEDFKGADAATKSKLYAALVRHARANKTVRVRVSPLSKKEVLAQTDLLDLYMMDKGLVIVSGTPEKTKSILKVSMMSDSKSMADAQIANFERLWHSALVNVESLDFIDVAVEKFTAA